MLSITVFWDCSKVTGVLRCLKTSTHDLRAYACHSARFVIFVGRVLINMFHRCAALTGTMASLTPSHVTHPKASTISGKCALGGAARLLALALAEGSPDPDREMACKGAAVHEPPAVQLPHATSIGCAAFKLGWSG